MGEQGIPDAADAADLRFGRTGDSGSDYSRARKFRAGLYIRTALINTA